MRYYDNEKVLKSILKEVDQPGWRIWKVVEQDGTVRQNKKKINNIIKLREFIGHKPLKLYVGISQFLNPERVHGKDSQRLSWAVADMIFVKSELFFDIDSDDFEQAHKDAKALVKYMDKERDYTLDTIRFSGTKGFHLNYIEQSPPLQRQPYLRLKEAERRRQALVDRLPKLKCLDDTHKRMVVDQFRVQAAINSIKGTEKHKVVKLYRPDFMRLSAPKLIEKYNLGVVRRKPMIGNSRPQVSDGEGSTLTSPSIYYRFVDNLVSGTKGMYVPVLKYPVSRGHDRTIRKIQRVYNLSDFYKIVYNDTKMYICLKIVDKERLEKILLAANAHNALDFMHKPHTWIPISKAMDQNNVTVWKEPRLVEVLESEYGLKDTHSRPHSALFNVQYPNMAGDEQNAVCLATVEKKK